MSPDYFREGGPFHAQRVDRDHISWRMTIKADEFGRVAQMCPDEACSPGYFKVKAGTGITEEQPVAYCPYCRREEEPRRFLSAEQSRYMEDIVQYEVTLAVQGAMKSGFQGKKHVSCEPARLPVPRQPLEDAVQRDVVCPHCGLDHAVFGIALWCPDCGRDIFMTHVKAEYTVVRKMLDDVDRRREQYGPRVAARDLENCLEDMVSIFEAVLKAFVRRRLHEEGETDESSEETIQKRVRNAFQNLERGQVVARDYLGQDLFRALGEKDVLSLKRVFEKRHPITHNLGVVDRKYIEHALSEAQEGRDVLVTKEEILWAVDTCQKVVNDVRERIWGTTP